MTKKTEREEAAYIAGRIDAQVLCNMYFAASGISPPELHGGNDEEMGAYQDALEASAIKFALNYGPLAQALEGDKTAKARMAAYLQTALATHGLQVVPLRKTHKA